MASPARSRDGTSYTNHTHQEEMTNKCRPAISSMSLGRAHADHQLLPKLDAAAAAGLQGIEMFEEDLITFAEEQYASTAPHAQLAAANDIQQHCRELGLGIVCLQPFRFYEGLTDPLAHAAKIREWRHWLQLARALQTPLVSVASTFGLPGDQVTGDIKVLAADLAELADLAADEPGSPVLRVSYEALAWGSHVDTWEKSWEVICRADRPNLGLCLDTFNIAARVYADPEAPSGFQADGGAALRHSLARLAERVPVDRIYNVQLVDGERLKEPLVAGHAFYQPDQPARMSWSRQCRLFYRETDRGAYLPVADIARVVFEQLQYRGWVSMELFSRTCASTDSQVAEEHAQRAMSSWRRLCEDVAIDADVDAVPAAVGASASSSSKTTDRETVGDRKAVVTEADMSTMSANL